MRFSLRADTSSPFTRPNPADEEIVRAPDDSSTVNSNPTSDAFMCLLIISSTCSNSGSICLRDVKESSKENATLLILLSSE